MQKTKAEKKAKYRADKPNTYFLMVRLGKREVYQITGMQRSIEKLLHNAKNDQAMWGQITEMFIVELNGLTGEFKKEKIAKPE